MKERLLHSSAIIGIACSALGQGSFQIDQQTSGTGFPATYVEFLTSTVGQTFVPQMSSVGSVQVFLSDSYSGGSGVMCYMNLRANSLDGVMLGTTEAIYVPVGFTASTNFLFSSPVNVTPGATYAFEVVVQSGDRLNVGKVSDSDYPNGSAYNKYISTIGLGVDLWFREGVITDVPEPASISVFVLGLIALGWRYQGIRARSGAASRCLRES